ncbi:hypothetical protein EVAR_76674_1 [Eumeta japonica]|uniref:Uncharacterized protein n=1 Tax=Eumeta variegata TaxID=151549 RepID=A0A4C1YH78_EUMVA|nr:hypothetical protein EVAR_76674_1 [Eumeta japonica]
MIDARLNFKQQVEHVSAKASAVRARLSRLMPNVGGPKQKTTVVLSSQNALGTQETWIEAEPVYRLTTLGVASAFHTISKEVVCAITGILPEF